MLNRKHKNDLFLVLGIFALALIGFIIFKSTLKEGNFVNVVINGEVQNTYSLSQNIETEIKTTGGTNLLVIENGYAIIKDADCPDKICVEHRKISKTGETIVCLPHKLVIEITENE
jgi:hypothetical protein